MRAHGVGDRPVEPELHQHRRPELPDEGAHVAQLAAQQLAQEAQLGAGHGRVGVEDAVDELHLEDRVRQRLGRAVVDLLGEADALALLGLDDPHLELGGRAGQVVGGHERVVAALDEQPRRLEVADGELEARELRLVAADRVAGLGRVGAGDPELVIGRARPPRRAPPRGRRATSSSLARSRSARSSSSASQLGDLVDVRLAVAVADTRAACWPRSQALQPPRRGARRSGQPRARPEVHPSARVYRPWRSFRRPHGRFRCRGARDAGAGDPEHPHVLDRLGIGRVVGDRQQDLLEAGGIGVGAVEDRGPRAVVRSRSRSATSRRSARRGRGRPPASRRAGRAWTRAPSPRARSGSRGSPARSRRAARRWRPSRGRSPGRCAPSPTRRPRSPAAARTENSSEAKIASVGPSQATGRVQPRRLPSLAMPGVERAEGGDQQQHVDRGRGVEEGAPGRRDREQQARREEREQPGEQHGADGTIAALPRQGEQPEDRDRDADQQQDVEQVVADADDAQVHELGRADREVAGEGRRVVPGEDVEPADRERVGQRLARAAGCRTRPSRGSPTGRTRSGDDGDGGDQANPDGA